MKLRRRPKACCHDCRVDTLDMPGRSDYYLTEYYMVHDDVWAKAGMTTLGRFLCVGLSPGSPRPPADWR